MISQPARLAGEHRSEVVVRIYLIGPIRAVGMDGENLLPRSRKARGLLAALCLAKGMWLSRARLASMFWDMVPDTQARASLRQALREITRSLGPHATELLEIENLQLRIKHSSCWVDVHSLLTGEPVSTTEEQSELLRLGSGQLLEDLDGIGVPSDQWLLEERSRFAERLRSIHEAEIARLELPQTDAGERVTRARQIIALDPVNEAASRLLMVGLAKSGNRAQALREYDRLTAALKTALDIAPSTSTRAVRDSVRIVRDESTGVLRPLPIDSPGSAAVKKSSLSPVGTKLRLGVLPFGCLEPRVAPHLPATIANEVAAALTRFRWFDVIAPEALPSANEGESGRRQALRDTGIHYALDGLICSQGEQLAVSIKLLSTKDGGQAVWTETLTFDLAALDDFLERIVGPIAARVDPALLFTESRQRNVPNMSRGMDALLEAIPLLYGLQRSEYKRAGELLERGMAEEPDNALIPAHRAFWLMFGMGQRWAGSREKALREAEQMCVRAIRLDPANAQAMSTYAHLCAFYHHDFDTALSYFALALRLNPHLALGWALSAVCLCYVGQPDTALERMARYRALAPFDPYFGPFTDTIEVLAYLLMREYDKAIPIGRRSVKANPDFTNGYKPLIAALGHQGHRIDAAHYVRELRAREPSFTIAQFKTTYPFKNPADREHYVEGLRLAGVSEA